MANNEVRKDYFLNRWVVIAKERKKRPTDFVNNNSNLTNNGVCPLCPGNERVTPPAVLVYRSVDGAIKKEQDTKEFIHKDWVLRVIPNLYPVFDSTKKDEQINENFEAITAIGHHEVIVESRCHDEDLSTARPSQLTHVINAYLDRIEELSKKTYVKHVAIFRNYGPESGASLAHPHSQLVTTPLVPSILQEELTASKNYWDKNNECKLCSVLKKEINSSRFIWKNQSFAVFAPWASINPFEFWVVPKRHSSNMLSMSNCEVTDLAETMRVCFGGLRALLNDPSYNFGVHTVLTEQAKDYYHWHLEVYPRLGKWGGFEKSTGMLINSVSPEYAASELRGAVQAEKTSMK